jgi:hypothetical protein
MFQDIFLYSGKEKHHSGNKAINPQSQWGTNQNPVFALTFSIFTAVLDRTIPNLKKLKSLIRIL